MIGALIIIVALVVVIPVSVIVSGGILAALISTAVQRDVDNQNPDSELLGLNG